MTVKEIREQHAENSRRIVTPVLREPTEEGKELYNTIMEQKPNFPGFETALDFWALENRGKIVDVGWYGMLLYEAGMIAGKREAIAEAKSKKEVVV